MSTTSACRCHEISAGELPCTCIASVGSRRACFGKCQSWSCFELHTYGAHAPRRSGLTSDNRLCKVEEQKRQLAAEIEASKERAQKAEVVLPIVLALSSCLMFVHEHRIAHPVLFRSTTCALLTILDFESVLAAFSSTRVRVRFRTSSCHGWVTANATQCVSRHTYVMARPGLDRQAFTLLRLSLVVVHDLGYARCFLRRLDARLIVEYRR